MQNLDNYSGGNYLLSLQEELQDALANRAQDAGIPIFMRHFQNVRNYPELAAMMRVLEEIPMELNVSKQELIAAAEFRVKFLAEKDLIRSCPGDGSKEKVEDYIMVKNIKHQPMGLVEIKAVFNTFEANEFNDFLWFSSILERAISPSNERFSAIVKIEINELYRMRDELVEQDHPEVYRMIELRISDKESLISI